MRICIVGPIATENVVHLLGAKASASAPAGYIGAPILATLIESLIERGHDIVGITTDASLSVKGGNITLQGERLKMLYCPQRRRAFLPVDGHLGRAADGFRLERRFLVEAIRAAEPDVVHAHWLYEFAWAAQDAGFPHVLTAHDSPAQILKYSRNLYRAVRYLMARRVASRARHLTTVSPYMQTELAAITTAKIDVVPNPLPKHVLYVGTAQAGSVKESGDERAPRLAMVFNGWGSRKNGEAGLRAFSLVRHEMPEAELYLYGQGVGKGEEAARWAEANGLADGVRFVGRLPHEQLLQQLSTCGLLLHPALEESFGAVLIEAMSLGVPVVGGHESGAVPWVVGEGGRLVDVSSPQAMARAALALLSDPEALAALGAQARTSTLARFSPDAVAAAYEGNYRQALAGEHSS